jgi:aspartyl-tRNA(Asn)/glutamyl-tRNA(Gln) amidotransferase subunit B
VVPLRAQELLLPGHAEELPDLSQYDEPIAFDGYLDVEHDDGETPSASASSAPTWRRTPASRCTSAAPPAASTAPTTRWSTTTVPASRSSRSSPSRSRAPGAAPAVAKAYVAELRDLLRPSGVSDVRMEQGSLRCDVNVSLRTADPRAGVPLGHPHRDQERQLAALGGAGGALRDPPAGRRARRRAAIVQETRHWHEDTGVTTSGRSKVRRRGLPLLPRARPGAGGPDP